MVGDPQPVHSISFQNHIRYHFKLQTFTETPSLLLKKRLIHLYSVLKSNEKELYL